MFERNRTRERIMRRFLLLTRVFFLIGFVNIGRGVFLRYCVSKCFIEPDSVKGRPREAGSEKCEKGREK